MNVLIICYSIIKIHDFQIIHVVYKITQQNDIILDKLIAIKIL